MDVQTKHTTLASATETIHSETNDSDALRPDGIWNANKQGSRLQCMEHANRRFQTYNGCRRLSDCEVCRECAFCGPQFSGCWKKHLPRNEVKERLKAKMKDPTVQEWLHERKDVDKKTSDGKKIDIYLKFYMHTAPDSKMLSPGPKHQLERQCVLSRAGDAYTNDGEGNPDPTTAADIETLHMLNNFLYPNQPRQRRKKPISLEDVLQGDATTIKHLRSCLTQLMTKLVPEGGKEALRYVFENDRARHTKYLGGKGEDLVHHMARVYLKTNTSSMKDIMLQQMCAVLTRAEVNAHLRAACKKLEMFEPQIINQKKYKNACTSTKNASLQCVIYV